MINEKKLAEFLIKAKLRTYSSENRKEIKIGKNGKQLKYLDNDLKYTDTYFGFNPFAGEELVFENEKCIWIMNYYGKIISKDIPEEEIYRFLRKAMRKIKKEKPFRGPASFNENDLEYKDENEGNLDFFKGEEKILFKGKIIYILNYHGGAVKTKTDS
jgi:hypothetical protein